MRRHLPAIALAVAMLVVAALLAFFLHQDVNEKVLSQFSGSHLLVAQQVAGHIESHFEALFEDIRRLASLTSLQHLDAMAMPADVQATRTHLNRAYVKDIVVLDATGKVAYSAAGAALGTEGAEPDMSAWAQNPANRGVVRLVVKRSEEEVVSTNWENVKPPSPHLILVTPIYQEPRGGGVPGTAGTFSGMLQLTIDMDILVEGTLGLASAKDGSPLRLWAMDSDGTLLLQPEHPEMVLRNIQKTSAECQQCHTSFDYVKKMLTAKQGTLEYQLKGLPSKLAAFAPMTVEGVSWIVVVNAPRDDVTGFVRNSSLKTLGLFCMAGMGVGLAFLYVYRTSRQDLVLAEKAMHLQEKERLVDKLRETTDYLESLFDSANSPIIVWSPDLRITRFNRACERLTGYAASEVVGMELRMLFPEESWQGAVSRIVHALGGEEEESPEIPILRKNGEIRIVLWNSATIHTGDGTAVATIAQGKDITLRRRVELALRESEEKFRSLFESSHDAIVTLEPPSWRFTNGNPAALKMFGAKSEEELVSHGPDDLSPERQPDGRVSGEKAKEMIEAAVRDGSCFFEWTHRRIGGQEFPADVLLNRIEHGQTAMLQATVRDITERKQAEQMKADFVSFATHQLRTPLSGIRWLLELAEQGEGVPEEVASLVADARTSAERLITLVNDLLAVSRIEGGRFSAQPQPVDLSSVTTDVVNELMPLVSEKNHRLSLPDDVSAPLVNADPKLVREVVLNLLSNAIKYTPDGGSITVSMKVDRDVVRWAVHDTGIGVPVDARRRLFEKFYRAENATIINTEGTGLGLYLARLIVERSGGRVWCESEEGQGSTFLFTLPIAPEAAQGEGR